MKKLLVFLVSLLLISPAFAGDESSETRYSDVQSYDFGFSVESDDGHVELEWSAFSKGNLKWYKFVSSATDSNPTYPENTAQYLGADAEREEAKVWLDAGSYYVRLCAITHDNERYCSKVQKLVVEAKEHKKDYEKKEEVKKKPIKRIVTKKTTSSDLSEKMKDRIDTSLEKFVTRLEGKGYDDEKMTATLEKVIVRLEGFRKKERYAVVVGYMVEVLQEYIEEYTDSFGDLENLLGDF